MKMNTDLHKQKTSAPYEELLSARLKMQGDQSHHLELVCVHKDVEWINHSISTSIEMTWHVLRDVHAPAILIIGGIDRAEDQNKLAQLVNEKVQTVICLGSTPWKYFEAFRESSALIIRARDIEEAIQYALVLSKTNAKTVLFSPSCPSYDAFDNYKNRGNAFRRLVLEKIKN